MINQMFMDYYDNIIMKHGFNKHNVISCIYPFFLFPIRQYPVLVK